MKILAWITEGGWEACVDAAAALGPGEVTLLHVAADDVVGASGGALAGLLGRHRRPDLEARLTAVAGEAAAALLATAGERLGRPEARLVAASGRPEDVVLDAAGDADVLVLARDGRRAGPRSLGPATRFVADHAPCTVVLAWPGGGPVGGAPPAGPAPPPPPGPPHP